MPAEQIVFGSDNGGKVNALAKLLLAERVVGQIERALLETVTADKRHGQAEFANRRVMLRVNAFHRHETDVLA